MNLKELERNLKVLANKRRLAILQFLMKGEAQVSNIAEEINLSFKSTSKHLNMLSRIDVLEREQRNTEVFYRLSDNLNSLVKLVLKNL